MAIHYTCRCGANIRLPNNVAGRKARCNSCGFIFAVPLPELNPEPESIPLEAAPPRPRHGPPDGFPVDSMLPRPEGEQAHLLDFTEKDDIIAPPVDRPRYAHLDSPAQTSDWDEIEFGRSYWVDLATSFFFFLDGGSLITFMFITLIHTLPVVASLGSGMVMVVTSILATLIVWGYLCSFYMAVVKETAGGEDELPNLLADGIYDLLGAVIRFAGTWAWVLLPASAFAIIDYVNAGGVDWGVFVALAVMGLFFWPVVVLAVSIGGGFHGLWPHTIIRTALAAPLAYLALCTVLLVAAGINALPHLAAYQKAVSTLASKVNGFSVSAVTSVVTAGLSAYSMIVAMRAIGLYYRHYKRKFPWVAE